MVKHVMTGKRRGDVMPIPEVVSLLKEWSLHGLLTTFIQGFHIMDNLAGCLEFLDRSPDAIRKQEHVPVLVPHTAQSRRS